MPIKNSSSSKILDIDEETLKDVNNISEEERSQITREIDAIMKSGDSSSANDKSDTSKIKKGLAFPLLLNSILLLVFAGTIIGARFYYQQQIADDLEENRALSQSSLSLAQLIIRENRLRLQQSQSELERIQSELESLGQENQNLESVASKNVADFERRVSQEIEIRRQELLNEVRASNLSQAEQQVQRRRIEAELTAEVEQRMQEFEVQQRSEIERQKQEYQAQIDLLQDQFSQKQQVIDSLNEEISSKAEEVVIIQEREKIVEVVVPDKKTQEELRILRQRNLEKDAELRKLTSLATNITTLVNASRFPTARNQIARARSAILTSKFADSQELRSLLGSLNALEKALLSLEQAEKTNSKIEADSREDIGLQAREVEDLRKQNESQRSILENLQSENEALESAIAELRAELRRAQNDAKNLASSQNAAGQELVSRSLLIDRDNEIKRLTREKNELNSTNRRFVRQLEAQQNGFELESEKLETQITSLEEQIDRQNVKQRAINRDLASNISTIAAYYSATKQGNNDPEGLKLLREIAASDELFRSIAEVVARTLGVPSDL